MNWKKGICAGLVLAMAAALTGCAGGNGVYVQSVKDLVGLGGIAPGDRFAGIVVSENVAEIRKDGERTITEILVKEGQDVKEGDPLFSYDTEELQLTLDKQRLELEQLNASIENYKEEIEQLEKDRKWAGSNAKLQYTVEIQSLQVDLKEAELNVKTKEAEVKKSEDILENATVTAPVTGRIQSVNENGSDNNGNPLPFIAIQQSGAYRIKGTLGELQRGGIVEGTRMKILSRTDKSAFWYGTVTLVDYENPSQGNSYDMYYGTSADEMTSSSKYPFYVELENTDGLILGQHMYLELATEEGAVSGPAISGAFLCFNEDGSVYVWAEKNGRLEKRTLTVGEYNPMMDTYEILEGLTEDDYIAFPDPELCREGAPVTHELVVAPEDEVQEVMPAEGGVA